MIVYKLLLILGVMENVWVIIFIVEFVWNRHIVSLLCRLLLWRILRRNQFLFLLFMFLLF